MHRAQEAKTWLPQLITGEDIQNTKYLWTWIHKLANEEGNDAALEGLGILEEKMVDMFVSHHLPFPPLGQARVTVEACGADVGKARKDLAALRAARVGAAEEPDNDAAEEPDNDAAMESPKCNSTPSAQSEPERRFTRSSAARLAETEAQSLDRSQLTNPAYASNARSARKRKRARNDLKTK